MFSRIIVIISAAILVSCSTSSSFAPATPMPSASLDERTPITRIALGSCFHPGMPGDIFTRINAEEPDLFIMLGDNIYAQSEADDPALTSLRQAYADLSQVDAFTELRRNTPVAVIWDDHDYGLDDAGGEFPAKAFSEALYEYAWAIEDERASRPGTYFEQRVGPPGQQLQLIGLDTRFFRTPLTLNPEPDGGRYRASQDPDQNVLGEAQWAWLEATLKKPADIRILLTSIQLIADGHHWEAWAMLPKERLRLYQLINDVRPNGLLVVSGDRHSAAFYRLPAQPKTTSAGKDYLPYPLHEMTTSSLNVPLGSFVENPTIEPGPHRITRPYFDANYGLIDIDWETGSVTMQLRDVDGQPVHELTVEMSELR